MNNVTFSIVGGRSLGDTGGRHTWVKQEDTQTDNDKGPLGSVNATRDERRGRQEGPECQGSLHEESRELECEDIQPCSPCYVSTSEEPDICRCSHEILSPSSTTDISV